MAEGVASFASYSSSAPNLPNGNMPWPTHLGVGDEGARLPGSREQYGLSTGITSPKQIYENGDLAATDDDGWEANNSANAASEATPAAEARAAAAEAALALAEARAEAAEESLRLAMAEREAALEARVPSVAAAAEEITDNSAGAFAKAEEAALLLTADRDEAIARASALEEELADALERLTEALTQMEALASERDASQEVALQRQVWLLHVRAASYVQARHRLGWQ